MRDDIVPLLDRHLDAFREQAFVYGQSDCVMFCALWLKSIGVHVTQPVYASLHEGAKFLVALDAPDVAAVVDRILPRREVLRVRVGDIVAHKETGALGLFAGGTRAAFMRVDGLQFVPLSHCSAAWSVEPCPQ